MPGMKVGGYIDVPIPLGVVLITLHFLAEHSFKFSQQCHKWWLLAMCRWGNRAQLAEFQKRLDQIRQLADDTGDE